MKVQKSGVVLLAALALLATGCRSGGDEGEAAEGEISAPGVSSEACPEAVNADNGCISLGSISDLTAGPFAPLGVPITDSQKAFWQRVNDDGGIAGYDIDVTEFVKDNLYSPETHKQVYGEISGDVLALAQSLGSPTTLAILGDLERDAPGARRRDQDRPAVRRPGLGPGVRRLRERPARHRRAGRRRRGRCRHRRLGGH